MIHSPHSLPILVGIQSMHVEETSNDTISDGLSDVLLSVLDLLQQLFCASLWIVCL